MKALDFENVANGDFPLSKRRELQSIYTEMKTMTYVSQNSLRN